MKFARDKAITYIKNFEKDLANNNVDSLLNGVYNLTVDVKGEVFDFFADNNIDILQHTSVIPLAMFEGMRLNLDRPNSSMLSMYNSEFIVPKHIIEIKTEAFYNNHTYESVLIGENVERIGVNVFTFSSIKQLKFVEPGKLEDVDIGNMPDLKELEISPTKVEPDTLFCPRLTCWRIPHNYKEKEYDLIQLFINRDKTPSLERIEWVDRVRILKKKHYYYF